mgnify:CR=1 FL=1
MENQCLRLRDSKTGKKVIYLSTAAIELLKNIPQEVGNPFVICGGKEGTHLINLQKPWRRIRAKVGLDDVRIHDLFLLSPKNVQGRFDGLDLKRNVCYGGSKIPAIFIKSFFEIGVKLGIVGEHGVCRIKKCASELKFLFLLY